MTTANAGLRAVLEALDEPQEFHGRSARIAYNALRAAGVDDITAGWHTAKAMHADLETTHRLIGDGIQYRETTTMWQRNADRADYARRLIVLTNLRNLIVALAPAEAA